MRSKNIATVTITHYIWEGIPGIAVNTV